MSNGICIHTYNSDLVADTKEQSFNSEFVAGSEEKVFETKFSVDKQVFDTDLMTNNNSETFDTDFANGDKAFDTDFDSVVAQGGGNIDLSDYAKKPKIGWVTLLASAWVGENNLYHQIVDIEGVTENSQVDLTPHIEQLAVFYDKDLTFVTENENGIVTVYAVGQKPANDYTIQVTITEVSI